MNHDQAIFDAIVAATSHSLFLAAGTITIDTQKFIETFNNHRDRALCTSIGVAQASVDCNVTDAMVEAGARVAAANRGHKDCDHLITTSDGDKRPVWKFYTEEPRAILEAALASPPAALPAETVTVPLEALRNCGCPADFRATVGQCEDSGQCGCSINLKGRAASSTHERAAAAASEDPRSAPAGDNNGSDRGPRSISATDRGAPDA